ncbi:MAG TPA: hypothetical protein VF868_03240 [Bacteroidia bacterium]|jgi:hypothetical protein
MNNIKGNNPVAHQTLHGYLDGHSMIASSFDFPPDAKRLMLTLSDMSGHSMISGFEEYLTGYQINELKMYAIAKTWYAPEMDRPGCVWTHTILLSFPDLIKIKNKSQILKLFKRPGKDVDLIEYDQALNISLSESNLDKSTTSPMNSTPLIRSTILGLYSESKKPVYIVESSPERIEETILDMWLQQWPRLRRNFSFCTGAIKPRTLNGSIMDIQVIPSRKELTPKLEENAIIISRNDDITSSHLNDEWVSVATHDLFQPGSLRDFFVNYGADLPAERSAFRILAELYVYLFSSNDKPSIKEIVSYIGVKFPLPEEAQSIKAMVFGEKFFTKQDQSLYEDLLIELCTTPYFNAFQLSKKPIIDKALKLFELDSDYALKTLLSLINHDINPIGVELVTSGFGFITSEESAIFNKEYRKLLLVFLQLDPSLSYKKSFWNVGRAEQREYLSILFRLEEDTYVDWQKIISVLIDEELDLDPVLQRLEGGIEYVLNHLNNSGTQVSYTHLNIVKSHPKEVLSWLKNNSNNLQPQIINLIVRGLNPNSREVRQFGCKMWDQILKKNETTDNATINLRLKAFCVALAFDCSDSAAFNLLSKSIESVYWALYREELDYDSWRHIEVHTKPLKVWKDWDKCKKLLNALVEKFKETRWPFKDVGKMFSDNNIIGYLARKYNE